jgi:hypothetical protein
MLFRPKSPAQPELKVLYASRGTKPVPRTRKFENLVMSCRYSFQTQRQEEVAAFLAPGSCASVVQIYSMDQYRTTFLMLLGTTSPNDGPWRSRSNSDDGMNSIQAAQGLRCRQRQHHFRGITAMDKWACLNNDVSRDALSSSAWRGLKWPKKVISNS